MVKSQKEKRLLDIFLNDIRDTHPLTIVEEIELSKRIQEGDELALEMLITNNIKLVVKIATGYAHLYNYSLEDLISEGNYGLAVAARKFLPTKNAKFSTYAAYWIKSHIERYIKKQARHAETFDYSNIEDNGYVSNKNVLQFCTDEYNKGIEYRLNNKYTIEDLSKQLTEREKKVLFMYFGIEGGKNNTLKEVAKKMNVSSERIRQIIANSLKKMKNFAEEAEKYKEGEV